MALSEANKIDIIDALVNNNSYQTLIDALVNEAREVNPNITIQDLLTLLPTIQECLKEELENNYQSYRFEK